MNAVLVLACLLCASPVRAADRFALPLTVYAVASAADVITTARLTSQPGVHEQNPLIHWLEPHPVAMLTAGEAINTAVLWGSHRLVGRNHPKAFRAILYVWAGARLYAAVENHRLLQRRK